MVIHIEFDIKITDHNGIVLQSAGNQCNENVSSDVKQDTDTVLGIDFTDFLAEYLSTSGFFLREKLMKGYSSEKLKRHVSKKTIKECTKLSEFDDECMQDLLKDSELEYKIRIGDNKVLIGKIPLKLDADQNPEMGDGIISASLVAEEPATEGDANNVLFSVSKEETNRTISYDSDEETKSFEASDREEEVNSLESSDSDQGTIRTESADSDEETICSESSDSDESAISTESSNSERKPAIYNFLNYSMLRAIEKYEDNIYNVWYEDSTDLEPAIDE